MENSFIAYTENVGDIEITGKVYEKSIYPECDVFTDIRLTEGDRLVGQIHCQRALSIEELTENVKAIAANPFEYYNQPK